MEDLTIYDRKPEAMINYLRYNGPHFSKKLVEFAFPQIRMRKEEVEKLLEENGVKIIHGRLYDSTYVANMCMSDYYGSSIEDRKHLALYIKDTLDDKDGYEGIVFNRFYADCAKKGIVIDWENVL